MDAQVGPESNVVALHALRCAFFQLRPPPEVLSALLAAAGSPTGPTLAAQALLLRECLHAPLAEALCPASADYRRRLLRAVVLAAEAAGCEADEELMSELSACLLADQGAAGGTAADAAAALSEEGEEEEDGSGGGAALPPGWGRKVWFYSPARQTLAAALPALATLEARSAAERRAVGGAGAGLLALQVSSNLLEGGTGCHEWEAGFRLAEFVLSSAHLFAGLSCLELGCGAGMVGVALARAGAASVLCTDGDGQTVANCRRNLLLNGLAVRGRGQQPAGASGGAAAESAPAAAAATAPAGGAAEAAGAPAVACRRLRWEEGAGGEAPDVVLGADLLYDPSAIPSLLALLKQLLAGGGRHGSGSGSGGCTVGGAASCTASGGDVPAAPAAYIATTRRNEATLAAFLAAVDDDLALRLEDLSVEAAEAAAGGVRFHHHAALEGARGRILLHRLTLDPRH